MPDPALLALIQHFASPPPAVIEPIVMADAEPFLSAFEAIADDQDRILEDWLLGVAKVKQRTRDAVSAKPDKFDSEMFDDLIQPFERYMRWQRRDTARLERRSDLHMSERARRLKERALARRYRRYDAASDLVEFLREVRNSLTVYDGTKKTTTTQHPNGTTVAAMKRARAGNLEVVTLDDLRASILADD